jgi:GNAT superfamily N-acetyltransferase
MSIEQFHQRLRERSTKVIYDGKPYATAAVFENSFVFIEPTEELPDIAMVRGIWVDPRHRGKGVASKTLSTLVELAEENEVALAGWIRPFEVMVVPGFIEGAAKGFLAARVVYPDDFLGERSAKMRRLLRNAGFEYGFDYHKDHERSHYEQVSSSLCDYLHIYVPKSLSDFDRQRIDKYRIDTTFPSLKMASLVSERFQCMVESVYTVKGKDAFFQIGALWDTNMFTYSFLRIRFLSGKDSVEALKEIQATAFDARCGLIAVTPQQEPIERFGYDIEAYRQALIECDFVPETTPVFLEDWPYDFRYYWLPDSIDESIQELADAIATFDKKEALAMA